MYIIEGGVFAPSAACQWFSIPLPSSSPRISICPASFTSASMCPARLARLVPIPHVSSRSRTFISLIYGSVVPVSVENAVKRSKYVQYSALVAGASATASAEVIYSITEQGLVARPHDKNPDLKLTFSEWLGASETAEELIGLYRPEALARHRQHRMHVTLAERQFGWTTALQYDVQQREAAARNPHHDIGPMDATAIMLIHQKVMTTCLLGMQAGSKRSAPATFDSSSGSSKRVRQSGPGTSSSGTPGGHCFRCGEPGCRPSSCTKSKTITGRTCAALDTKSKSADALRAPDGRSFCLGFAIGRCNNITCLRNHTCSVCAGAHGAGSCPSC
jgi:hypothetical protein